MSSNNNTTNTNNTISNEDINQMELPPDVPMMRSVLIRSATSEPTSMGSFCAGSGGFLQHSKPSPKTAPALLFPNATAATAVQKLHGETNKTSPAANSWNPEPLPKLPFMYPLERSHAKVQHAEGVEIANRIAACLQKESIAATFSENKAMAETPCRTQFFVTLFEDDSQVVVEVQRRTGCSWKFSQCSKAILSAAKGEPKRRGPPEFKVPSSIKKMASLPDHNNDEAHAAGVQRAMELLNDNRIDAKLLGMTSLMQMTKDTPMNSETISSESLEVIFQHARPDSALAREALTVIANLLQGRSIEISMIASSTDVLLPLLLSTLVHDDLHRAHQAARCLTALCQQLPDTKQLLNFETVQFAHQKGVQSHSLLSEETKLLVVELEQ